MHQYEGIDRPHYPMPKSQALTLFNPQSPKTAVDLHANFNQARRPMTAIHIIEHCYFPFT